MRETSKALARRLRDPNFRDLYFVGRAIDIGAGPDSLRNQMQHWPKLTSVYSWDVLDGDAQVMAGVPDESYDLCYSSHCLEHMVEPWAAIRNWWRILKPGGFLVVVVPDEDMYERGQWPSIKNADHKATFTVQKFYNYAVGESPWSPSVNLAHMLSTLRGEIVKIERLIAGFDPSLPVDVDQTAGEAECAIEFIVRKRP